MKARFNPYATSIDQYKRGSRKTAKRVLSQLPIEVEGYALYSCPKCGATYRMFIVKGHTLGAKLPDKFICMHCIDSATSNDDLGGATHILEGSPFEKEEKAYKVPQNEDQEKFVNDWLDPKIKMPFFYKEAVNLLIWSVTTNSFIPIITAPNALNREMYMIEKDKESEENQNGRT